MNIQPLKDIGLTEAEAKIYFELLKTGPSSAGAIIKKTGLHKATVYQTLARLEEKGIVSRIIKEGVQIFQSASPKLLLEQFREKEEQFKGILPELLRQMEIAKSKISAEIFSGRKGIISVYRDILKHKEYLHLGAGIPIVEVLGPFFYQFQKIKKERGIKARILVSEDLKNTKIAKEIVGDWRYLSREFEAPINTIIYGGKIAIIVWTDLVAFVLESKDANMAYRKYFEALWKIAKP